MVKRLWRDWVYPYRWRVFVALILMAIVAGVTSAYPLVIDWTFDLLAEKDPLVLSTIPFAVLLVTWVKAISLYSQTVVTSGIVNRVIEDLQRALYRHLVTADLSRLQRDAVGTLTARFTVDMEAMRGALNRTVTGAVRDSLTVVALAGTMIYLDWLLALIVFTVYPAAGAVIVLIGKRLRQIAAALQAGFGGLTALLNESLAGARMVKAYRLETYEMDRAGRSFRDLREQAMRAVRVRAALEPFLEVSGGIAVAGVVAFAAWRITTGEGSVGDFTGFVAALLIAAQPVRAIGGLNASLQEGLAAAGRLFEVLDEPPTVVDRPTARPLVITGPRIEFRAVSFGYQPGRAALNRLELAVEAGETVALVGRSGGGKSTIFNLIARLYDPDHGQVLVDGQDLQDVTLASLRDSLALVSQDAVLFDDSVRANIGFGKPGAGQEAIEAAAHAAALHEFILSLPEGYGTRVGEQGGRLSGGQKQRLALARAFLRDAPILLLDEATSALDAESERLVQGAIERLTRGRTTLIIAHRLATVRGADRICVVEDGRITEQGRHDELLQSGGAFARLYALQMQGSSA